MVEIAGNHDSSTRARPAVTLSRRLALLAEWMIGLALIGVVLVNVANAGGRYLFGAAILGADELMVFVMVFIVMTGAVLALAGRRHICINLLPSYASGRALHALHLLYDAVGLGVFSYAAYASWSFVSRIGRLGTESMSLGIPMTIPHSAVFIGFTAMAAVALSYVVRDLAALASNTPACGPEEDR